jgi:glyceraldehyde 3-phosphate dehydrogenase
MAIKVGINGFGRIGRLVFRAALGNPKIEVVGINDLFDAEYLAYMLKYDTVHGVLPETVSHEGNALIVNGRKIRVTGEKDPAALKWGDIGAEYVCESTGLFLDAAGAKGHLAAGAKRVVMSAPSKDDTPMFVMGVNHTTYKGEQFVSNASCTTNCLAPVAKVLHDNWGISDRPDDHGSRLHGDPEDGRRPLQEGLARRPCGGQNIIPSSTGAAKAVGEVMPSHQGQADRHGVPRPDAERLRGRPDLPPGPPGADATSTRKSRRRMKKASQSDLKGILGVHGGRGGLHRLQPRRAHVHLSTRWPRLHHAEGREALRQGGELVRQRVGLFQQAWWTWSPHGNG